MTKKSRTARAATKAGPKVTRKTLSDPRRRQAKAKPVNNFPKPAAQVVTSKQTQLAAMLVRDEGATLDQMIALTGWLPHTTRAAMTGLRKKGYVIDSDKLDGVRTYRAVTPQ